MICLYIYILFFFPSYHVHCIELLPSTTQFSCFLFFPPLSLLQTSVRSYDQLHVFSRLWLTLSIPWLYFFVFFDFLFFHTGIWNHIAYYILNVFLKAVFISMAVLFISIHAGNILSRKKGFLWFIWDVFCCHFGLLVCQTNFR